MEAQSEGFFLLLGRAKSSLEEGTSARSPGNEGGWGRGLSCRKNVFGSLPVRGPPPPPPPKFLPEKRRLLSCFVLYGGLVFLDFHLFPKDTRKDRELDSVSCHPSPDTQTPFQESVMLMFGQNSVLIHFLMPPPPCSIQRESFQNKFWV